MHALTKILAPALMLAFAAPASAEVNGEVIAAYISNSGNTALFSAANGGQYAEVTCFGDPSYGGSPRFFLQSQGTGYPLPDGYGGSEIVASNEACTQPDRAAGRRLSPTRLEGVRLKRGFRLAIHSRFPGVHNRPSSKPK